LRSSSSITCELIAVIVSGYDGEGTEALCGIRAVGGITIAQTPDIAKQPDMPESAIASGRIDYVLSPEAIAQEIARIACRSEVRPRREAAGKMYQRRRWPGSFSPTAPPSVRQYDKRAIRGRGLRGSGNAFTVPG
jgi:hypothetical protein